MDFIKNKIYNLVVSGTETQDLSLVWRITNRCNFRCSYCQDWKSTDIIHNWKDKINEINTFCDKIRLLIITGGEPTLHPDLLQIIRYSKIPIRLWSNLTADISIYKQLFDTTLVEIYTSFHPEFTSYKTWIEKIKQLSQYTSIKCNIMESNTNKNLTDEQLQFISKFVIYSRSRVVGIKNYYENNNISCDNEYLCNINGKKYYTSDRNQLSFITKMVQCDMNHRRVYLPVSGKYSVCGNEYDSLSKVFNTNILCRDSVCTAMMLRRGNKRGLFRCINDGVFR